MNAITALSYIGAWIILSQLFKFALFVGNHLRPSRLHKFRHTSRDGKPPWAVVTGASDGIGLALANEFASEGFNVVLHGRNPEKLSRVKDGLQAAFPDREFRVLVADASLVPCTTCLRADVAGHDHGGSISFESIHSQLQDLHITVLVNNAGGALANPTFEPLRKMAADRIAATISLNALFPIQLTRALFPILIQSRPALVINMSSLAAAGLPLLASYGASKSMIMTIVRAVGLEMSLEGRGADVEMLGIQVGKVTGVSHMDTSPTLFTPSSQTMAKEILKRAGYGHRIVAGYWGHAVLEYVTAILPRWLQDRVYIDAMRKETEMAARQGK